METAYCIVVQDSTHAGQVRRTAMQLATELGLDEVEAGNIGLVVTEASKNLLKHAGGGSIIMRAIGAGGSPGVEMLAVDKGPGIRNIGRSFQDGYSTAGTPGTGLGAISRLSNLHDIYSLPGQGTALLAQVWKRNGSSSAPHKFNGRFRIGAVSLPMAGMPVCGDAWGFLEYPAGGGRLTVADGLGHGLLAADAARAAVRIGGEPGKDTGVDLMQRIHGALRPTRGAAVALAEIDCERGLLRYTGIGNIGACIVSPAGQVQRPVSHNGTAGHEVQRIAEFQYPWDSSKTLIMFSDGLMSHWSLDKYPGLLTRHPSVIAGILHRDYTRGRDDVTVVVLQHVEETR